MSNSYETLRKMTLTDVAAMIHKKEVSPVDLVDACLEQIDKYDGHLRAFITVEAEQSRKVAKASEDMLMAGYDTFISVDFPAPFSPITAKISRG